jgi:hypothetical protein
VEHREAKVAVKVPCKRREWRKGEERGGKRRKAFRGGKKRRER